MAALTSTLYYTFAMQLVVNGYASFIDRKQLIEDFFNWDNHDVVESPELTPCVPLYRTCASAATCCSGLCNMAFHTCVAPKQGHRGLVRIENTVYLLGHSERMNHTGADAFCRKSKMALVSFEDGHKMQSLGAYLHHEGFPIHIFWTSGYDAQRNGQFAWQPSRKPVDERLWFKPVWSARPAAKQCVMYWLRHERPLTNQRCSAMQYFICERPADSPWDDNAEPPKQLDDDSQQSVELVPMARPRGKINKRPTKAAKTKRTTTKAKTTKARKTKAKTKQPQGRKAKGKPKKTKFEMPDMDMNFDKMFNSGEWSKMFAHFNDNSFQSQFSQNSNHRRRDIESSHQMNFRNVSNLMIRTKNIAG